uniref:URB2 ribosome biogenesis 2 homolog n=1 Tax=Nothobranchius rachovii TaxID=451742 RepID=A0A1A8NWE6_9TELE
MSAIYSGIYLKLKNPQTSWEDRLKLARFAWISSQCLLPNKEQVLLDWCTHALTGWHSKKVDFSQEVLEVQHQQANPNRVFTLFTNQLIQPLMLLRYLLTSQDFTASHSHLQLRLQLRRDLRSKIDSVLQSALFPSEHFPSYKAELFPSKEDSVKHGSGGSKGSLKPTITANLGRSKPMDETLIQMLARITSSLGPAVETFLKTNCNAADQPASTPNQAYVVEVVTAVLDCELASLSVDVEGKQNNTQLAHMTLYQVVCQQILREMSSAPRPMDFLISSLHFLSAFYKALVKTGADEEMEQLYVQILQNVLKLLKAPWLSSADVGKLEPGVQELLRHLVEKSTMIQFNLLLLMIREGLDISKLRAGNYREGEGLINNPHHVILILSALQSLPLDHLAPPIYHSAFLAVHEALFTIIQCHPQVVSTAAPSFLNVFYRLVASIMQEGRQKGDADTGVDSDLYLQCSRLVERMYSHIAAAAESFTALPAFMVAQYVTELQKVTLRPDIKLHLTEGVYCILDLCMEQDIKFLKAGLNMGVREVFNELHGSYVHYHKPQRQGEDKYTV